jgi:hypothetical protein
LLGDSKAKVGNEDFFKPNIGNDILHEIGNDDELIAVTFDTLKNLTVKCTIFIFFALNQASLLRSSPSPSPSPILSDGINKHSMI